jgi:hypothetical protein
MQFLYIIEDFNISQGYSRIFEKVLTYSWGPYFNLSTVTTRKSIFTDVGSFFFADGYDPPSQISATKI